MNVAELERAQFRTAGLLSGEQLRSLDAVHVAAAPRWQADAVLTYDHWQAQAGAGAGAGGAGAGIRVLAPR